MMDCFDSLTMACTKIYGKTHTACGERVKETTVWTPWDVVVTLYCIVFIHFYSASHSLRLSETLPTTAIDTVGVYMPKRYRQL